LWNFQQRLAGYRRALVEARLPFDPALVLVHEPPAAPAAARAARLLSPPDAPTAAFAAHNLVALRLVEALQDAGVRIPEELSLVVSAEEDWTRVVQPRLSAVEFPGRELGAAAARLLLEALRQTEPQPRPIDSHGRHRMPAPDERGAGEKSGKNGKNGEDEARMPPLEHTVEILTAPLAVRASSAPPSSTRSARVPGSAAGAESERNAP
jgi:hypothetical protein